GRTRARRRVFVSGAHWYGETDRPERPSVCFDEVAEGGEKTGAATVDRGPEHGEDTPLLGYRESLVRDWPGPAAPDSADELFPEGWRSAALLATSAGGAAEVAAGRDPPSPGEAEWGRGGEP